MRTTLLFIFVFYFQLAARADVSVEIRRLFSDYVDSMYEKNYKRLTSLMDTNFLEKTGGEEKWRDVLQEPQKKEIVDKVEVKKVNNYYFARFSLKSETQEGQDLAGSWFVLTRKGKQFLLHDFAHDFDPGAR